MYNARLLSASVGIIGGADGPTAIFVSQNAARDLIIIAVLAVVLTVLIILFIRRKRRK